MLSKCSWTTFWQLLTPSWAHFGLNLESLERLLGSTCGLLGAFGAHLGAFWPPLGLYLGSLGRLLGQLRAFWAPNGYQVWVSGRQVDSNCAPSGRPDDLQLQRTHEERQDVLQSAT